MAGDEINVLKYSMAPQQAASIISSPDSRPGRKVAATPAAYHEAKFRPGLCLVNLTCAGGIHAGR